MVTLDRLVNVLGAYGVRLRFCSIPRSTELGSVAMHETDRAVVGDVLLAVGASSAKQAVRWAVSAHASVVLMRGDEQQTTFAGAGEAVAVMVVDYDVSWSELAAVVYGLVLEGRETASGRGPTDLFALADSLAEAIGAAVVIEDSFLGVLAYSRLQRDGDTARVQTILGRQPPDDLRQFFESCGVLTHLTTSDAPLFVPPDPDYGFTGRMVIAARVGRELLGSVWVSCSAPLTGDAEIALVTGARTVALHLLRSQASADLERQVESDLVIRLIDGTADAATVPGKLGLPQSPLRVIALRAHIDDARHAALLLAFEQATSGFGWSRPGRSAIAENTIYTLLPEAEASAARRWIDRLRAGLPDHVTVVAGISGAGSATDLAIARREADECLALHELRGDGDPPAFDDSWHDILLHRLRSVAEAGRAPTRGPVVELRRHDENHATQYVETLRAWLEAQGDPVEAGERLGVHENTVRYRLRKMAEVTALDLDDGRKRLALMIELAAADDAPLSGGDKS